MTTCASRHPSLGFKCVFGFGHEVDYHFGGSNDSNGNMGYRWTDADVALSCGSHFMTREEIDALADVLEYGQGFSNAVADTLRKLLERNKS